MRSLRPLALAALAVGGPVLAQDKVRHVGDRIERPRLESGLRLLRHGGELRAIRADVGHLVRDDQVVLRLDRHLHVVADDAGAAAARCHRARVGIGE